MAKIIYEGNFERDVAFKKGTLVLDKSNNEVYICTATGHGCDLINLAEGSFYFGCGESLSKLYDLTKSDSDLVILPKGSRIILEQE